MRRILSTTFISCSHGEIRFLQSKKELKTTGKWFLESNPIDYRTRNRNRTLFQKFQNLTALLITYIDCWHWKWCMCFSRVSVNFLIAFWQCLLAYILIIFVASGLDINGCVLSYFEGTANLHCYTSCTLTTLHCSKVSFLQCCHMKRYNNIFTKMWGVYSLLWDTVYIYIYFFFLKIYIYFVYSCHMLLFFNCIYRFILHLYNHTFL